MINYDKILIQPNTTINLRDYETDNTGKLKDKGEGKDLQKDNIKKLKDLQEMLYAFNRYAVLLVFQAMDAAGKDSTIRHVLTGINPAGCQVHSFKQPSDEELDHDFLWRTTKALPSRAHLSLQLFPLRRGAGGPGPPRVSWRRRNFRTDPMMPTFGKTDWNRSPTSRSTSPDPASSS